MAMVRPFPLLTVELPLTQFPFTVELYDASSNALVWATTVEAPRPGRRRLIRIPPISQPVRVRALCGDGSIFEVPAPERSRPS